MDFDPSLPGAPLLSIADVSAPKGHSGTTAFDFAVKLTAQPSQPVTLDYATTDGSATLADGDYQSASGSLTFTPGGPLSQTIQVEVVGNTTDEPDETFFVNLSDVVNATVVKPQGLGTIQNDATPISISDVSAYGTNNGTTPFTFTVSLASASSLPVSVDYTTADGTATLANGGYQAQAGTLTFNPGETTQTISILVNGNSQPHPDETFYVNLVNPVNGIVAADGQQGVGTILGDSSGTSYYVNDTSTVGDVFCTAPGNYANDGKSPATPVASLAGLLSMYTFHAGDTIYVDTGAYALVRNIVLGPQYSGVRIVGPGPREVTPSLTGGAVLADGPVAFWRLGDASGGTAVDATGNGYDGTYVGGLTPDPKRALDRRRSRLRRPGRLCHGALRATLNPSQFTIEAWVNFQDNPIAAFGSVINVGIITYIIMQVISFLALMAPPTQRPHRSQPECGPTWLRRLTVVIPPGSTSMACWRIHPNRACPSNRIVNHWKSAPVSFPGKLPGKATSTRSHCMTRS